jgi:hypothetical protein
MAMTIQLKLHLRTPSWAEKGLAIRRQGAQEKHSREVKDSIAAFPDKAQCPGEGRSGGTTF